MSQGSARDPPQRKSPRDGHPTFRSDIEGPYWRAFMAFCFFFLFFFFSSSLIANNGVQFLRSTAESFSRSSITILTTPPPHTHTHSHPSFHPLPPSAFQNKQIRWLTVSCPPWGTCMPLWRIIVKKKKKYQRKMKNTNAASLRPQVTRMKKKNPFVRHGSSGPLENKKKKWRRRVMNSPVGSSPWACQQQQKTPCDLFSSVPATQLSIHECIPVLLLPPT